jgi:hypothetical protein
MVVRQYKWSMGGACRIEGRRNLAKSSASKQATERWANDAICTAGRSLHPLVQAQPLPPPNQLQVARYADQYRRIPVTIGILSGGVRSYREPAAMNCAAHSAVQTDWLCRQQAAAVWSPSESETHRTTPQALAPISAVLQSSLDTRKTGPPARCLPCRRGIRNR